MSLDLHLSSRERAMLLGEIDRQAGWLRQFGVDDAERDLSWTALKRLERAVLARQPVSRRDCDQANFIAFRAAERRWLLDRIYGPGDRLQERFNGPSTQNFSAPNTVSSS